MKEGLQAAPSDAQACQKGIQCKINRDTLLAGLKTVAGVVESSQVMQVLSHVHISVSDQQMVMVASDSEVELMTVVRLTEPVTAPFKMAVSCRKLLDVCRTLPPEVLLSFIYQTGWLEIRSERAHFTLATLPPETFPMMVTEASDARVALQEQQLKLVIHKTHFAMAHQDVRFFLNGLHLALKSGALVATATDGHRLARCVLNDAVDAAVDAVCVVPRKATLELLRLLEETGVEVTVSFSARHIQFIAPSFTLTTTLLEGQYPACDRLLSLPDACHTAQIDCAEFKQVLSRAAILSHDKFKGAKLAFLSGKMEVTANNAEQEKSEDGMNIQYDGDEMTLAFNVGYLVDVLNVLNDDMVCLHLTGGQNSVLLTEPTTTAAVSCESLFLIMPLTL
jgi:DNA polymerase III subunit beta